MKNFIKNIIFLFLILLIPQKIFAAEILDVNIGSDYVMSTEKPVSATTLDNPEIATVSPFFTIFNEKNVFLLHPQKLGSTTLTFFQGQQETVFRINVKSKSTAPVSCGNVMIKGAFEISVLDCPPPLKEFEMEVPNLNIKKEQ